MLKKVLLVFILLCIFHELNGRPQGNPSEPSPVQEAIQKINPELDKISARLKTLKFELQKSSLQASVDEHESLAKSARSLLQAIADIESNTTEISEIANNTNINITKCVSTQKEKMERIFATASSKIARLSEESRLRTDNFTEKANGIVKKADDIDKNINKIIGYCIRQNGLAWQQEKLVECLFREADYLDRKVVDGLYKEKDLIQSNLNTTKRNTDSLLLWVSNLQTEFLQCVSEAETYLLKENTSEPLEEPKNEDLHAFYLLEPDKDHRNSSLNYTQSFQPNEEPRRILQKIQRLQLLLDQLKQVEGGQISGRPKFGKPNRPKFDDKNQTSNESEKNEEQHPFILYISM